MKLLISLGKFPGENRVSAAYGWRSAVVKLTEKSQWNADALFIHQIQTSDEWMQHLTAWVWVLSLLLRGSSTKYHVTKNSVAMNADLFWTLNANKQGGGALNKPRLNVNGPLREGLQVGDLRRRCRFTETEKDKEGKKVVGSCTASGSAITRTAIETSCERRSRPEYCGSFTPPRQ